MSQVKPDGDAYGPVLRENRRMPPLRRPTALRLADVPRQPWYPTVSAAMIAAVAVVEIAVARLTSPTVSSRQPPRSYRWSGGTVVPG
ncbi:hypothetical protein [Salinispora sp. H7-4]|uniref:hypothetical protein n=1 Tax=Salinispora sp. H7-4 TaxID=2748321 RepID=UPI002102721C|nr:hypothetical protein [Salinispora sp. H7-4]